MWTRPEQISLLKDLLWLTLIVVVVYLRCLCERKLTNIILLVRKKKNKAIVRETLAWDVFFVLLSSLVIKKETSMTMSLVSWLFLLEFSSFFSSKAIDCTTKEKKSMAVEEKEREREKSAAGLKFALEIDRQQFDLAKRNGNDAYWSITFVLLR